MPLTDRKQRRVSAIVLLYLLAYVIFQFSPRVVITLAYQSKETEILRDQALSFPSQSHTITPLVQHHTLTEKNSRFWCIINYTVKVTEPYFNLDQRKSLASVTNKQEKLTT